MTNVTKLPGAMTPLSEPVQATIEHLEDLLARARTGEIRSIAYVVTNDSRKIFTGWHCNGEYFAVMGGVAWLQKRLLDEQDE